MRETLMRQNQKNIHNEDKATTSLNNIKAYKMMKALF